jgi:hypothetical protein
MDLLIALLLLLGLWVLVGLLLLWFGAPRLSMIGDAGIHLVRHGRSYLDKLAGIAMFGLAGGLAKDRPLIRQVDRRWLLVGEQVQVSLQASAHGVPEVRKAEPWDIALLVDHSGSMGSGPGSPLEAAKQAIENLALSLPTSFRLALVEFDERGHKLCDLSHDRRSLRRAVRRIGGGGGTDIAAGLETAGELFPEAEEEDGGVRLRALVLLSDGCGIDSRRDLEQAAEIKARDVTVFTLGLGDADAALLAELASEPGLYFRAQGADQLLSLYQEIGARIAGDALSGVDIAEFLFAPAWRLRGFGEIRPAEHTEEGRLRWLLCGLGREGRTLSYRLEANCPGWHRIGTRPATLSGQQEDGQSFEAKSNLGPRVLVLPSVLGGEWLRLFLNPLFYLLFGRFASRCPAVEPYIPPAPPKPSPLEPPPPLAPLPDRPGRLDAAPALAIGLGYAGIHALTHCKRLFWERDETAYLERVRFLAVDTAAPHYFPPPGSGTVALDAAERLILTARLESLIAEEAKAARPRHPWLPAGELLAGGARPDLGRGTGQCRALGRLAALANREALEAALRRCLKPLAGSGAHGLEVVIAASTGGGTGGGMLIDLCWMARRALDDLGCADAVIALFLLPPFGAAQAGWEQEESRRQRYCNHRALMTELERVAGLRGEGYAPAPDLPTAKRLADRIFLAGPTAVADLEPHRELYPRGGELMFAWLSSEGLRRHFLPRPAAQGRARGDRVEPGSAYLYPRSLGDWLALETLSRLLVHGLLDGAEPDAAMPALLESFQRPGKPMEPLPWLFSRLDALADPAQVGLLLQAGQGPVASRGLDALQLEQFLTEQDQLTAGLLAARVGDALNGASVGLRPVQQALLALRTRLEAAAEAVAGCQPVAVPDEEADEQPAIGEHEALLYLAVAARRRVQDWAEHLAAWEALWGEGDPGADAPGAGVLALAQRRGAALKGAIEAARLHASPRLVLSDADWAELPGRHPVDGAWFRKRLAWEVQPGGRASLALKTHGERVQAYRLGDSAAAMAEALVEALLDILRRRIPAFYGGSVADYLPPGWAYPVDPPMGDTEAYYLAPGEAVPPTAHVPFVSLEHSDPAERRLFSVNHDVPLDRAWQIPDCRLPVVPHVLTEEFHAYRLYHAHCRRHGKVPGTLDPRLVALFRDPERVRRFVAEGLAGGGIALRERQGRRVWMAGDAVLGEVGGEPAEVFFEVARNYLGGLKTPPVGEAAAIQPAASGAWMGHGLLAGWSVGEALGESFLGLVEEMRLERWEVG